jgi:hypothetical protein
MNDIIQLLISIIVGISSAFFVCVFGIYANGRQKRKEQIVTYLITAYNIIADSANRKDYDKREFEKAIDSIYLLGTDKEISCVTNAIYEFKSNSGASFDELLKLLRKHLRKELGLKAQADKTLHFRFIKETADNE